MVARKTRRKYYSSSESSAIAKLRRHKMNVSEGTPILIHDDIGVIKKNPFLDSSNRDPPSHPGVDYDLERINHKTYVPIKCVPNDHVPPLTGQLRSTVFISYFLIAIIMIGLCLGMVYLTMPQYALYVTKNNFPDPIILYIGSLISTFIIIYCTYRIHIGNPCSATLILSMFMLYNIFIFIWHYNLIVKFIVAVIGRRYDGFAPIYLLLCITFLLVIFIVGWIGKIYHICYLLLISIGWLVALQYYWWYDR